MRAVLPASETIAPSPPTPLPPRERETAPKPSLARLGTSATSRIDADNVSSWKCGRSQATASYQPGLPLTARTSTLASDSGVLAFCVGPTSSGLEMT